MDTFFIPHFTPTTFLYFVLITSAASTSSAVNITAVLSPLPDFSTFTALLTSYIAADLTNRSPLTILAVPNPYLTRHLPSSSIADILRYHILLEYLSFSDLEKIPSCGKLITTVFQTTGRATANYGSVNITRNPSDGTISIHALSPNSPSNATVLSLIYHIPYNISIFSVNSLLIPSGFDLMTADSRPPFGLNITKSLIDGHNFNVVASMLIASGVVEELEAFEGGAGITLFVPTDTAFSDLQANNKLQSLPADKKAVVLKFHVLHSYYPLGSLESIVNPVQPTLATEHMGAGSYTLNISRVNGSVAINTGIVQASVTQTVIDQNPIAIFGVSKVLLPVEIFGKGTPVMVKPSVNSSIGSPRPPEVLLSPENSPALKNPPPFLSPPPEFREEIGSEATVTSVQRFVSVLFCIALYLLI